MDQTSKELLKRDLFVQGLVARWQQKVVPSAENFGDALHQARLAEEHDKQISEIRKERSERPPFKSAPLKPVTEEPLVRKDPASTTTGSIAGRSCFRCGSTRHKARECQQKKPPDETTGRPLTSSQVTVSGETEDSRCARLQQEWLSAEHQRMMSAYKDSADVGVVTGAVGPVFYANVRVEGMPIRAMVDPGSAATILSFEQFSRIGKETMIPSAALRMPDLVLRDYNQQPIPIGALVTLSFKWKDKAVTTSVYVRSDQSNGEPCLLGTIVVMPLGLMTPDPDFDVQHRSSVKDAPVKVRLVSGTRIPLGHALRSKPEYKGEWRKESLSCSTQILPGKQ